jgi:hypothetical protein
MTLFRLCGIVGLSFATTVVFTSGLEAQIRPIGTIAIGDSYGRGGTFTDRRSNIQIDALIGAQRAVHAHVAVIAGVFAGMSDRLNFGDDLSCPISPIYVCVPDYPEFKYLGIATGAEVRSRWVGALLTVGPGAFSGGPTELLIRNSNGSIEVQTLPASTVFGGMARVDVTAFFGRHFGIFASGSTRVVPKFRGDRLQMNATQFLGIRVQ